MTILPAVTITNIKRCDITTRATFSAKFAGMQSEDSFTVFGAKAGDSSIVIQSKTRIGEVFLDCGTCRLSKEFSDGVFFMHLAMASDNSVIQESDMKIIKEMVRKGRA